MKKIFTAIALFSLFSCATEIKKEAVTSAKAGAASSRINQSDQNSSNIFKELDE